LIFFFNTGAWASDDTLLFTVGTGLKTWKVGDAALSVSALISNKQGAFFHTVSPDGKLVAFLASPNISRGNCDIPVFGIDPIAIQVIPADSTILDLPDIQPYSSVGDSPYALRGKDGRNVCTDQTHLTWK
jgi:hypothetical protein